MLLKNVLLVSRIACGCVDRAEKGKIDVPRAPFCRRVRSSDANPPAFFDCYVAQSSPKHGLVLEIQLCSTKAHCGFKRACLLLSNHANSIDGSNAKSPATLASRRRRTFAAQKDKKARCKVLIKNVVETFAGRKLAQREFPTGFKSFRHPTSICS